MPAPYAVSSDLVSAWPAKSLAVANYVDSALAAKTDLAMAKNAQTGTSYSYALTDQTKLLTMSNASANTVTVTKQATVAWAADTQLRVLNIGAGATTLVADTGVTINNNTALAQWRGGVLIRMSSDVWTFVPFVSGSAGATVSGTTGSPTTGTGKEGKALYTWTSNGSVTFSVAGLVRVVAVSGGASGVGGANSGSGGEILDYSFIAEATTYTVTIGAGGVYLNGNGGASSFVLANKLSVRPVAGSTINTGNGNRNSNATGLLTDISGSSVGYGGAGYSSANSATYNSIYGGAQQTTTLARANSGGGGNEVGSGNGAAGIVQILV